MPRRPKPPAWSESLDWDALTPREATRARTIAKGFDGPSAAVRGWPDAERWMLRPLGLPAPAPPEPRWRLDDDTVRRLGQSVADERDARELLQAAQVPDLERLTAYHFGGRFGYTHFYDSLLSLLARPRTRNAALDVVIEERSRRLPQLHALHAAEAWRGQPPEHPALKRVWAALRERQRATPALLGDPPGVEVIEDPPGLRLIPDPRGGMRFEVRVDLERGVVHGAPNGPETLALIDRLTAPTHTSTRDLLIAALAVPRWERDLAALDKALDRPPLPESEDKRELGWLVRPDENMMAGPVLCRQKKRGDGYVTRQIEHVPVAVLTFADERALRAVTPTARLRALVGHPRVFVKSEAIPAGAPVRVRAGEIAVTMTSTDAGLAVGLAVNGRAVPREGLDPVAEGEGVLLLDGDLWVFDPRYSASCVARLLMERGEVTVPPQAAGLLAARLPEIARHVGVEADPTALGRAVDPDPRPLVRFTRTDRGIDVEVRVQPLPEVPSDVPGEGAALCVGARDGRTIHVRRDLDDEIAKVQAAIAPLGLGRPADGTRFRWSIEDLPEAVAVVDRAREHAEGLRLAWSGERIRLASRPISARDLSLRVSEGRDWFGLDGDVEIEGHKLRMAAVLEAALEGHGHVLLSDGQWAGLSEGLRAQLAAAAAASSDKAGLSLGPQHAALVDALAADGAQVDAPPRWFSLTRLSREARDLDVPLPDGLNTELRSYQREGFTWLARLAHWAPGAVLADDMGLGKTVQSIALLLRRRDHPSLVVAPTSVVANWARELGRFAPSLTARSYQGGGRSLEGLGPGDVVLTSYGVLVRDGEALARVEFGTAVLDEAQAIKNPASQRAKAAVGLQAGFRLALSGTPVENRTSELWSLFRFVSPGLLGSPQRFFERFVSPIERGDRHRRALLARIVAPFLLRRTKREVERDLPDRTELRVDVELSPEERTLYDRARLEAATRLGSASNAGFQVFEELLRLRKLACNPALVDPGTLVASSKLRAVVRALVDLREAGHRALVFSSFTSHLALVRPALEAEGFTLRYLDGSMTARQRLAEVDAFQSGEGDVFLISLKAGGVGLNLTGATYVLHLDPWWNPAAEDQATDRAHRIGQTRAVTVLRFVSRGTVEDQILRLHETKRDLADALLSASGDTRTVTADQLLALLSEVDDAPAPTSESPAPLRLAEPTAPAPALRAAPEPPAAPAAPASIDGPAAASPRVATRAELLEALERSLTEVAKEATRRAYRIALNNLLAWVAGPDPLPLDALPGWRRDYVAAIDRDGLPSRSDKVYAGPALNRALDGLERTT